MKMISKIALIVFCCITLGCTGWAYRTPTDSMAPTITQNDMAVANPFEYWSGPIKRFDIVVIKAPEYIRNRNKQTGDIRFIERVIGLPNEKIEVKRGKIFVDNKPLTESFQKIESFDDFGPIVVPDNEYFLLGDNRPNSEDSRFWKPSATIRKEEIYSKIVEIKKDYYKSN